MNVAQPLFWPAENAFQDASTMRQVTDGRSRCLAIAICDDAGQPCRAFRQGQEAHFYYAFEVLSELGIPAGGLEFHNQAGQVIHGKHAFQYPAGAVTAAPVAGSTLRYHQVIQLNVAPGKYEFMVGLGTLMPEQYAAYLAGDLPHEAFAGALRESCRVLEAISFTVDLDVRGYLSHYGVADLPGACELSIVASNGGADLPYPARPASPPSAHPTIFHITHWKAGSQWIYRILRECAPDLIVDPEPRQAQFLYWPIQPGRVYPTVYVTRQQYESVRVPADARCFVVVRDLRDTLVSAYFSFKISHPLLSPEHEELRRLLQSLDIEAGMLYLIHNVLPEWAQIQLSWLESGVALIRYADLLAHDLEILETTLIDQCGLPVARERLRQVVLESRFEILSGGRRRGEEDVAHHLRRGVAGDWQNYFTDRLRQAFKARFGGLLVALGHAEDLNW